MAGLHLLDVRVFNKRSSSRRLLTDTLTVFRTELDRPGLAMDSLQTAPAPWQPRKDFEKHPVAIVGGGVLGRRLAVMYASRGGTVHLCDTLPQVREDAAQYFRETAPSVTQVRVGMPESSDL